MKYFVIFLIMIGFVGLAYANHDGTVHPTPNVEMAKEEFTLATLEWSKLNYRVNNGTGTAKVIVTDPDMNKISSYVDTLNVSVHSDSFQEGIIIKLYETERNSGIFERSFTISESRSAPNVLYVREGDTATVTYTDKTLPLENPFSEIIMMETTLIGHSEPPLERVPASNAHIVDLFGNTIDMPHVNEQITISSNIANQHDDEQKFAWITQIVDEDQKTVSLAWIDGTINPETSFSPSVSWIPENEGKYEATIFVWESLDNPTALSPPISLEFTVISEDEQRTRQYEDGNYREMFMFIIPQNEFEQFTGIDLRTLYYYKVNHEELPSLPRLSLLVNMTEDFPYQPVSNLKLRINDDQIKQYDLFFEQKCTEQRSYAASEDCIHTDFAFEYDEKWYYIYPKLALHHDTIEDSTNNWDPDYFTRK